MPSRETELLLKGYGLTTAEICYRMPDFETILQVFVWQEYDLEPDFPNLSGFVDFWREKIEGPLHSIKYCHRKLIKPGEWRNVSGEFIVH